MYLTASRRFLALALGIAVVSSSVCFAEPPQPDGSPGSGKQERARPQIIYHLSNASHDTSEALHSQSKAADAPLEIDPNMPLSLQLARANANASATPASISPSPDGRPAVGSGRALRDEKTGFRRGGGSGGRAQGRPGRSGGGRGKGRNKGR